MGDFAAGKMGSYSGPTGTASDEDVAQAIVDLEGLYGSKVPARSRGAMALAAHSSLACLRLPPQAKQLSDQIASITPASDDAIAATGAPTDLAAALKKRDGGHYLFDYRLFSCSEMTAKKARPARTRPELSWAGLRRSDIPSLSSQTGDVLAIGENIDGDMIGLTKDGAVASMSETAEVLAPSFGIYLLQFRDAVASSKVEWADVGWVSIDG